MYTISMTPMCKQEQSNRGMCFMQSSIQWSPYLRPEYSEGQLAARGVFLNVPQENVHISAKELAGLIAGLDTAYDTLAKSVYEDVQDCFKIYGSLGVKSFLSVFPDNEGGTPYFPTIFESGAYPIVLVHAEVGAIVCKGDEWWKLEGLPDLSTYATAGTCSDWEVRYLDGAEAIQMSGEDLCDIVSIVLNKIITLTTDEQRVLSSSQFV